MTDRFCWNCKWIIWPGTSRDPNHAECDHPTSLWPGKNNPVTGVPEPARRLACVMTRMLVYSVSDNCCGKEGKHWEAVDSNDEAGRDL